MRHAPRAMESSASVVSPVPASEQRIVLLLAAVQFVNILDFMMPSPLGPRFAADLGIETSALGVIVSSYTLSAGIVGFAGAFFLDRFDRKIALTLCLVGLSFGTVGAALAHDLRSLVLARVIAGAFGGPATSLTMAIISDLVPVERRGNALGTVMMAFAMSSVFGVPLGLALANWGSWHTPFVVTGLLCLAAAMLAHLVLPSMPGAKNPSETDIFTTLRALLADKAVAGSYLAAFSSSFGTFVLIPNIASFVQNNLRYPGEYLFLLYGAGGVASVLVLRPFGRLVDRFGSFPVSLAGTLGYAVVAVVGFVISPQIVEAASALGMQSTLGVAWSFGWLFVILVFIAFMITSNARNVSTQTLASRVPAPALRARYQSMQSMVQHLGLAAGGLLGPVVLTSDADGSLHGIPTMVVISIVSLMIVLPLIRFVEVTVNARR